MGFHVVWPALVSSIGAFILTVFGATFTLLSAFGTTEQQGPGLVALLPFWSISLSGFGGLYLSLRLSSHEKDHKIVGLFLLLLFSLSFYFWVQLFLYTSANTPGPIPVWFYAVASGPVWLLAGGIWAFFWKPNKTP